MIRKIRNQQGADFLTGPLIATPPAWLPGRYMMLRRHTVALLRLLGVEPAHGVEGIIAAAASAIERPITIHPHNLTANNMLGLTIDDPDLGFVVFVQSATTAEHRSHIVLHELAHIVLGTFEAIDDPNLGDAHRIADYTIPTERDAEYVARTIATLLDLDSGTQLSTQTDPQIQRLAQTLQDKIAW